jgi:coenzyme F420-reducing hydrogenase beta subunit
MCDNTEGFKYPSINVGNCNNCGKCIKCCPEVNSIGRTSPKKILGFKNKDVDRLKHSASGGAADLISDLILTRGGTVFGSAYNEDLVVEHIEVTKREELYKLQSSKYVQSDLNNSFTKVADKLNSGRMVLFTGTPCQVAGLYSYLGNHDIAKLYTIDLICHGVPSPLLFKKYIEYQEHKLKEKIIFYDFRSKEKRGWGTQYLIKTKTKTKTKVMGLDKYGRHFLDGDCYRESCYRCKYADSMRVADLTVGDFWGIEKIDASFFSEMGVSVVLANTDKGSELVKQIGSEADLLECRLEDILSRQWNLNNSTSRPPERNNIYDGINTCTGIQYYNNLKVGLAIKDRIKYLLPVAAKRLRKRWL